jgi:D-glycero-D-manno-heptose 1,7-bisphosphate phosphatase
VTNQSGVGRGLYDEAALSGIHDRMSREVEAAGGSLAGIYACLHAPEANCLCRKPRTGLIESACRTLGVDAVGAPMVGDRMSDLRAARAAGCRPYLVRSGCPIPPEFDTSQWQDVSVHADLQSAVDAILSDAQPREG